MSGMRSAPGHARRMLVGALLGATLLLSACGQPGALAPAPTPSAASPTSTATPPSTPSPAPSGTPAPAPEESAGTAAPPSAPTRPEIPGMPLSMPPNPYHSEPEWRASEPVVRASLQSDTVDVYAACTVGWAVRVAGLEVLCAPGLATIDEQPPILVLYGVPVEPGALPVVEQQYYTPRDPEEHWATVVVVDPGAVPTATELGRGIEGSVVAEIRCVPPPSDAVGRDLACEAGPGPVVVNGLLATEGLATPPPLGPSVRFPGYALFFGEP